MTAARGPSRWCQGLRPSGLRPALLRSVQQHHRSTLGISYRRKYTIPSSMASSNALNSLDLLAPITVELDRICPSFKIHGSQIRIIPSPSKFYDELKIKFRNARRRIFIATLYIGKEEQELYKILEDSLRARPKLRVYILTDSLRGTRGDPRSVSDPTPKEYGHDTCAWHVAELVRKFPDRVEACMYRTPNLTGFKKLIPERLNEGFGLQHMKMYGFDDDVILSGANLSRDYFTNRQDRYHVFESSEITEYCWKLHQTVSGLSFTVKSINEAPGYQLYWTEKKAAPDQPAIQSPALGKDTFVTGTTAALRKVILPQEDPAPEPAPGSASGPVHRMSSTESSQTAVPESYPASPVLTQEPDTTVYMLAQMSQILNPDFSTELPAVTHILKELRSPRYAAASWTFTAGYFNPDPSLTKLLVSGSPSNCTVVTAAPQANGFYGSKGISSHLPAAYTHFARRFLEQVDAHGRNSFIKLKEWSRGTVGQPGAWTYHAKGLWVTLFGDPGPSISIIGSSNYTKRSYTIDLEAGALVVTQNEDLQKRLRMEELQLQQFASQVTLQDLKAPDRQTSRYVRLLIWIVSRIGGAL